MTRLMNVAAKAQKALSLAQPMIDQICTDSRTPGLAIGIFDQEGKVLDSYHGYRDISTKSPPDPATVFNIGSMCKGFTVLAVACLVAQGKVTWNDRADMHLDNLRGNQNGAFTIRDLLSHRTDLCRSDALFIGSDNRLLLTKPQGLEIFANLTAARPPRQDFIYNNFGYHVVGCIIENVSSMDYGEFLHSHVFKPLKMNRTFTKLPPSSDDNIAQAYIPYSNLQLREVPVPRISDDTIAFSAGCIRSCMQDLFVFYAAMLRNFTNILPKPELEKPREYMRRCRRDIRGKYASSGNFITPRTILWYGMGAYSATESNERTERQFRLVRLLPNNWNGHQRTVDFSSWG